MQNQVAAKAVIINSEQKSLIAHNPKTDKWEAVGGRLEEGENLEDGLRREVLEETGMALHTVGEVIHVDEWFAKPEGREVHIVALFFVCHTGNQEPETSDEHDRFAWVDAISISDFDVHPQIVTAIQKALRGEVV